MYEAYRYGNNIMIISIEITIGALLNLVDTVIAEVRLICHHRNKSSTFEQDLVQ